MTIAVQPFPVTLAQLSRRGFSGGNHVRTLAVHTNLESVCDNIKNLIEPMGRPFLTQSFSEQQSSAHAGFRCVKFNEVVDVGSREIPKSR